MLLKVFHQNSVTSVKQKCVRYYASGKTRASSRFSDWLRFVANHEALNYTDILKHMKNPA